MENFLVSVRCITPVLLTMCLGIWIRSWKLVPDEAFRQLSTVCFHGLLPIQLFYNTCHAELTGTFSPKPLLFLMTATLLWFGSRTAGSGGPTSKMPYGATSRSLGSPWPKS